MTLGVTWKVHWEWTDAHHSTILFGWTSIIRKVASEPPVENGLFVICRSPVPASGPVLPAEPISPTALSLWASRIYTRGQWDLSQYKVIKLRARAQVDNYRYKMYLKHLGNPRPEGVPIEAYFEVSCLPVLHGVRLFWVWVKQIKYVYMSLI